LRPSRELLEFYRQKISQFDSEQEGLLQTLEKYRGVAEDQVRPTQTLSLYQGCRQIYCISDDAMQVRHIKCELYILISFFSFY